MEPHRLIILGAGFSVPAGLPINNKLMSLLLSRFDSMPNGARFRAKRAIEDYREYRRLRTGAKPGAETINLEDFISYLDLEHYLGLKGSDTLSIEGNDTQIYVRFLIARLLYECQIRMSETQWKLYIDFAKRLSPGDVILTFNYDTILETACDRAGIKYRLCPSRFDEVHRSGSGTLRFPDDEIIICKLHGSIDWFSRERYDRGKSLHRKNPLNSEPRHAVFDNETEFKVEPLVEQPYPEDDPFSYLYRARNLAPLFSDPQAVSPTPFLVAPSHSKIVYLSPLLEFWYGFNTMGVSKSQLIVIGFSFPAQDEYALAPVIKAIANFQNHNDPGRFKPTNLKIVDFQQTREAQERFCKDRPFIDWKKTVSFWNGLSYEILDQVVEPSTFHGRPIDKKDWPRAPQRTQRKYEVAFPVETPSGDLFGTAILQWNSASGIEQFAEKCGIDLSKWCPVAIRISGGKDRASVTILAASADDYNQLDSESINIAAHTDDGIIYIQELKCPLASPELLHSLGKLNTILIRNDLGAVEEVRQIK
ncbi:MAG: SIR2 family protein [Phycisphaerae bacterium]|nr:SIR2 family protein [Phycisphaerae bacterium]